MSKPSDGSKARPDKRGGGRPSPAGHPPSVARETRHCNRCGGTLSLRYVHVESRRRFVCVECSFIFYQNPKVVAATLPVDRGRVWLLRRAIQPGYGKWTYPAGYMELGETVDAAASRETWEEIRARVRLTGAPRVYSYPEAGVVTVVYPARVLGRTPRPGPESLEVKAFRPDQIPWEDLAFRSTEDALRDWVRNKSG